MNSEACLTNIKKNEILIINKKRKMDGTGQRDNKNKVRYELVPPQAHEEMAKVLMFGAEKYGDDNWKKGMPWTYVLASIERHLYAIKKGEDIDSESGLLHSAHIMANAAFLTEYCIFYPEGDDRKIYNQHLK